MRRRVAAFGIPRLAAPIQSILGHRIVVAFPPDRSVIASATLVKMVSLVTVFMALRLVFEPVPGATPKQPASGLTAQSLPSLPTRSQEISSPIVWIFQPFMLGRRHQHRQIGLAAGARESAADIS